MPRADLHYAAAIDQELFDASSVDPTLLDPVVRVVGGLPGVARPFVALRAYQGPQGYYTEHFEIRDPTGAAVYTSPVQRIALEGEMAEDHFTVVVRDLPIDFGDPYELACFVGDEEVGAVPVFVEAGLGGDPRVAAKETFSKAVQKGSILWVSVPRAPSRRRGGLRRGREDAWHTQPVWFVRQDERIYVFSGPTEQEVPGLAEAEEVELTVRSKDLRSRVSRCPADVRVIDPSDPLFEEIGIKGLSERLNLPDGDAALQRWRENCVLVELTPQFSRAQQDTSGAGGEAA